MAFLSYKDNPPTLSELAVYLNRFGFADKARQAGLNMKSATAAFLRVYPEIFKVLTSEKGGTSRVSLHTGGRAPAAGALVSASAGASGSSGSGLVR